MLVLVLDMVSLVLLLEHRLAMELGGVSGYIMQQMILGSLINLYSKDLPFRYSR